MRRLFMLLKTLRTDQHMFRFHMLRGIAAFLVPEYRFKWPQMNWWHDQEFNIYLRFFNEESGMNTDRRWMMYQLTRLVGAVSGDTAECGVYKGAGSYLMCLVNKVDTTFKRTHHIFDSFEGLSKPSYIDGNYWKTGDLSFNMESVRFTMSDFDDIVFHKGWIPSRFDDVKDTKFAFVHIDIDIYQPIFDSISFFYDKMSQGGIILCDDYGFTTCPGATHAIDEFLRDRPEQMISLSAGGGFLIKGCQTSKPLLGADR